MFFSDYTDYTVHFLRVCLKMTEKEVLVLFFFLNNLKHSLTNISLNTAAVMLPAFKGNNRLTFEAR